MKIADGFDSAIIGVIRQAGLPDKVAYDIVKCIDVLIERDGMTDEEALEYLEFNAIGAYVGEDTPAWLVPYSPEEVTSLLEED